MHPLTRAASGLLLLLSCAAAPAANLLANPDFAANLGGWQSGGDISGSTFVTWTDEAGHDAHGAAYLRAGNQGQTKYLQQCIDIDAQSIDLYAYSRIQLTGGNENYGFVALSTFNVPDCAASYVTHVVAKTRILPGEWVIHRLDNHPLPAGTQSVMVFLRVTAGSSTIGVHMDDAGFGPAGTAGLPPLPANLLDNPDFERSIYNWTTTGPSNSGGVIWDELEGYPAAGSLRLFESFPRAAHAWQCVALPGGAIDAYALSRAASSSGATGQLAVSFFAAPVCNGFIEQRIADRTPVVAGWTLNHLLDESPPAGAVSAMVFLELAGIGTAYMDHAAFGASGMVGAPAQYLVAGSVSGLIADRLSLRLNDGAPLSIASDGAFVFPERLFGGSSYAVTVASAPTAPRQVCSVVAGTGTIDAADIEDVEVVCAPPVTYTIGGTVSGLVGSGLALRLNDGATLPIASNGAFTFPDTVADGLGYEVSIAALPGAPAQSCSVTNGSGTVASADVASVVVTCAAPATYRVGGAVEGLIGSGLALRLNGGAPLAIAANGGFQFPASLADGSSYSVLIATPPSAPVQTCDVERASGAIDGADVDDVLVRCLTPGTLPALILRDGFE